MSPSRLAFLALTTGLVAGCAYPPLAVQENKPQLDDSMPEREIVVEGTLDIEFRWRDDDGDWHHICDLISGVRGWTTHAAPDDVGCTGCSEDYTLAFDATEQTTCDFVIPGAATVAIAGLDFFPWTDATEYMVERLTGYVPPGAAGPAIYYAATDWSPVGEDDWDERLAVHELDGGPAEGFARAYHLRPWYYWGTSHGSAFWFLDLHFIE